MIYTTLNKIREHHPCESSWVALLESLGKTKADDEPLSMGYILDTLGLDDCLWATRTLPDFDKELRLLACDYAERALHIFEEKFPDDSRPRECIEVSRRFARGEATEEELSAAGAAAWAAAWDAAEAAWDAAEAAWSAAWAARGAAGDAGAAAERKWQQERLMELLEKGGE